MSTPLLVLCLAMSLFISLANCLPVEGRDVEYGYEKFNEYPNSRYKLPTFRLSWADALGACQGDRAHLLIVNTEAESSVVRKLMARLIGTGFPFAHVGIYDVANEGTWLTVLGGPVTMSGYNKWVAGQPNEGASENCGFVQLDALYHDGPCSAVLPFICEKPGA